MDDRVKELQARVEALKGELREARLAAPPEPVEDFALQDARGTVRLSELFGSHRDLILVHNIGERCSYCTLWADGLSAFAPGIERRAAFVVVSPDSLETQAAIRERREWRFRMVSDPDGSFSRAMGYLHGEDEWWPGVSGFRREPDRRLVRIGTTPFGPGDDFCAVWPLFDLVGGPEGWEPQ